MEKIDVAIIGGGIIGLMASREILKRNPSLVVCVFEKELYLGEHSSGRNSGVLHAGLYYENGSLKHRLCLEGNELWDSIAENLKIRIQRCGKYVVARTTDEVAELEALYKNAVLNEVPEIRWCLPQEEEEIREHINCQRALLSARTGIIDQGGAVNAVRNGVENAGGIVLVSHCLNALSSLSTGFHLSFENGLEVTANHLVNAAGLFGVDLRKKLGLMELDSYYVRGNYLKSSTPNFFEKLIYPVPEKGLKGLGVHLTFDLDGGMKFGPNTEDVAEVSYSPNPSTTEIMRSEVKRTFRSIDVEKLNLDYCGIRSKIKLNGSLYKDFWIKNPLKNYVELLGIESPGFTASPAIARMAVDLLEI